MASELLFFVASLYITGSGVGVIATDEYAVELSLVSINESELVYTCGNDTIKESPAWEIDLLPYRVTDLPFGYNIIANRLRIHPNGNSTLRCFFLTYTNGMFVSVYSNDAVIIRSTQGQSGIIPEIEYCDPENISIIYNDSLFYITWDIASYRLNCLFSATISNCSSLDKECSDVNVIIVNRKVKISLSKCVAQDLVYPTGLVIDLKRNSSNCAITNHGCSTKMYIPNVEKTETITILRDGLFLNISSPYSNGLTNLLFCFESLTLVNGCFMVNQLQQQTINFYLAHCHPNSSQFCLGAKDVNSMLNKTIVTVHTIDNTETPCNPGQKDIDTLLFNFILLVDDNGTRACVNCSQHATCKNRECVCKEGYTGDGMSCGESSCENCNQYASCKNEECVCKEGYTGDGISCGPNLIVIGTSTAGLAALFIAIIAIIVVCCCCYWNKCSRRYSMSGRENSRPNQTGQT